MTSDGGAAGESFSCTEQKGKEEAEGGEEEEEEQDDEEETKSRLCNTVKLSISRQKSRDAKCAHAGGVSADPLEAQWFNPVAGSSEKNASVGVGGCAGAVCICVVVCSSAAPPTEPNPTAPPSGKSGARALSQNRPNPNPSILFYCQFNIHQAWQGPEMCVESQSAETHQGTVPNSALNPLQHRAFLMNLCLILNYMF